MNDRYGWDDRDDGDRNRRHSGERSPRSYYNDDYSRGQGRGQDAGSDRWRRDGDDWRSRGNYERGRDQGRSDFDREQRFGGSGTFGYGEGRSGGPGNERVGGYGGGDYGSGGQSGYYGAQQSYASQGDQPRRRYTSSDYGYGAGQQGDTSSQQPFTGQQHAWEVPSSYGAPGTFGASYGGGTGTYGGGAGGYRGYGEDYREHGYGSGRNERGFLQRAGDEIASWFGDEDAARRREQDHRGRGPADYIRSDDRIREDANDHLTEDWRLDASRISVLVQDGEITLNGTVSHRDDKRRAEDIVEDISGVKHVQNNLRVQQNEAWTARSGAGTGGTAASFGSSSSSSSAAASSATGKDKANTALT